MSQNISTTNLIKNNSDFLFLYEAIQCNPNGDIDQENHPRMDYDNDINLVSDVRVKRCVRDFLEIEGEDIFVRMVDGENVSPPTRLEGVLKEVLANKEIMEMIVVGNEKAKEEYEKVKIKKDVWKELTGEKTKKNYKNLSRAILAYLVKQKFIDVRLFGSAFAIEGFKKPYTGPVQLNWGYSLHQVKIIDSSSLVTIMNDDNSTVGKDYRVYYSLLAFHGSVNKHAAISTGLRNEDMTKFRDAIWKSIPALPTRTKLNQYPKLYVEIIYNDGFYNGHFGDLRQLITATGKDGKNEKSIRKFDELVLDLSKLKAVLEENQGTDKAIKSFIIKTSSDLSFEVNQAN